MFGSYATSAAYTTTANNGGGTYWLAVFCIYLYTIHFYIAS